MCQLFYPIQQDDINYNYKLIEEFRFLDIFRNRCISLKEWLDKNNKIPSPLSPDIDERQARLFLNFCRYHKESNIRWYFNHEDIWIEVFGDTELLKSRGCFEIFADFFKSLFGCSEEYDKDNKMI